jgi:hypothetical protein
MPIIQYVMPTRNKKLKKLLHFYWEVCPKYDENGKLKQEMILVVCVSIDECCPVHLPNASEGMLFAMTW